MAELTVYGISFPLLTFVAAENPEEAAILAKKVWEKHGLEESPYNWNEEFNDVEINVVDDSCYGEGCAYYDENRFGPNLDIPIQQGIFNVNEKKG